MIDHLNRVLLSAICCSFLAAAHAGELLPGDSGAPDVFSIDFDNATASDSAFGTHSGSGLTDVIFNTAVYADPNNPFGAGDLAFLYQINNGEGAANDTISLVTATSFTGYRTDVGYTNSTWSSCFSAPLLCVGFNPDAFYAPSSVYRSASGDTVGFNVAIDVYPPASRILIIETNATNYSAGGDVTVTGPNGSVMFAAFQPSPLAASIPEPGTLALLGLGFGGLGFSRRRKAN